MVVNRLTGRTPKRGNETRAQFRPSDAGSHHPLGMFLPYASGAPGIGSGFSRRSGFIDTVAELVLRPPWPSGWLDGALPS